MHDSAILLVSCPDRKGVVASIADFIFRHNANILSNDEHADEESNLFLTRVEFDLDGLSFDFSEFTERFSPMARDYKMDWRLARSSDRHRIAIFVSKYDHCLQDLLYRYQSGELQCEIPLIISNHPDSQRMAHPRVRRDRNQGFRVGQRLRAGRRIELRYLAFEKPRRDAFRGQPIGSDHACAAQFQRDARRIFQRRRHLRLGL